MAQVNAENEPTLVERWLHDQQQWQKTVLAYLDSMVKNDDFLVHLGNAMRGSLLAGKPYPTAPPAATPATEPPSRDRLDEVLFALRQLEGQVQDLRMNLDEIRSALHAPAPAPEHTPKKTTPVVRRKKAAPARSAKAGSRKISK